MLDVLVLLGMLLAPSAPAVAQPVLERLEGAIRGQSGGTAAAQPSAAPAEPAPAPKPVPSAAPPAKAKPAVIGGEAPGYLGAVTDDQNDRGRGVRVLEVRPDGPAAKAGLKANDLVTSVAGVRIRQMSDLADVLKLFKPGDTVAMDVQRGGQPQQVKVTLGRRSATKTPAAPPGAIPPPPAPAPPGGPLLEPGLEQPPLGPPEPAPPLPPGKEKPAAGDRASVEQLQARIEQ
jgi:hypothetical protein